jgi:hypothetical protein
VRHGYTDSKGDFLRITTFGSKIKIMCFILLNHDAHDFLDTSTAMLKIHVTFSRFHSFITMEGIIGTVHV